MKLDCILKDFVRRRFVLAIFAIRSEMAYSRFSAINFISPQRSNAEQNPLVRTFIIPQTIPLPSYSFNAVYTLFMKCATDRRIPDDWKMANVVALHKKGARDKAENFRPVSLTCVLGKVYQKLVRRHIIDHAEGSVTRDQHGFISGRSCTSNLLEAFDTIIDMMDEGLPVDILYFDFRKAFDTVPHHRLLVKLENMGITGEALEIIKDFLSDREMRVGVGDSFSEVLKIVSGVPQGSVLGPILFLLFVNDLPDNIKSRILLFADDLKLIANAMNKDLVDEDLRSLERWEGLWQLRFNLDKCKVLHIAGNDNPRNKYCLDGTELLSTQSEKDLGFTMDEKFDFAEHIKASLAKANKMIAWVSRNVICKDKIIMATIYRCLVRPHLEYCVQCWCPTPRFGNWGLILSIEKVQRKFTRLVNDIGTLSYGARLKSLRGPLTHLPLHFLSNILHLPGIFCGFNIILHEKCRIFLRDADSALLE